MSWNAEGMFVEGSMTRRASPDDALAVLREVGADIVVVPEFGVFERMSEKTSSAIAALGYTMEQFVYGDERGHGTGLAILSRLPIESRQRIAVDKLLHRIAERRNRARRFLTHSLKHPKLWYDNYVRPDLAQHRQRIIRRRSACHRALDKHPLRVPRHHA
jgi:hypothetical protein